MNPALHNQTLARALAANLVGGGVEHVVASPGSRNAPLVLAFAETPALRIHTVLDERAAGFVALGLARASGRPVALVCTSGSALAHYLPAVVEARHARIPLIVLSADRPPELHDCGSRQTTRQSGLFDKHVRYSAQLSPPDASTTPRQLRSIAMRALAASMTPPGPVHINIPLREPLWQAELPASAPEPRPPSLVWGQRRLDEEQIGILSQRLQGASKGVILCGALPAHTPELQAHYAGAISDLGRALGWPILAGPASQLRFGPHGKEQVIWSYDALLRCPSFAQGQGPDCVLRFGQLPVSGSLLQWLGSQARDHILVVDPWAELLDPSHGAEGLIVAEPTGLCEALLASIDPSQRGSDTESKRAWLEAWQRGQQEAASLFSVRFDQKLAEPSIARQLVAALPDGAALHVANSMAVRELEGFVPCRSASLRVFANLGVNGIDGTLATASGEALAKGSAPVAVLTGDLAFIHDVSGLLSAQQLGVRLTIVLVNNSGGGIFGFLPIADHPTAFEQHFVTAQKVQPDSIAAALGSRYQLISSPGALREAIIDDLERPGVGVIELRTDREQNIAEHRQVWRTLEQALSVASS